MSMNKPDIEQIQRAVATSLYEHWVLYLVEGVILVILGLAAVVFRRSPRSQSKSCMAGSFPSAESSV